MSKNIILIAISTLFLLGAIIFDISKKSEFKNEIKNLKEESIEVKKVAELQNLWKGKGLKSKIEKIINTIPPSKRENYLVKRSKAEIKLNSLSDKELNRVLSKLAMLPIEFRKLQIVRSGDEFILECTCVW